MITFHSIVLADDPLATEPVTVADIKLWANIDHADDDDLLEDMNTGARQDIEKETNLALIAKTVEAYIGTSTIYDVIRLPYGTASDVVVSSVDTADGSEELLTLDDGYYLRGSDYVVTGTIGDYKIEYSVGTTVPMALKEAIKMLVAYRYNNRGDQEKQQGIPADVMAKVSKYAHIYL